MHVHNPLIGGPGAIGRGGTFVGRAAVEVCVSLAVGACRPAAESPVGSGPSVEEVRLQQTQHARSLNHWQLLPPQQLTALLQGITVTAAGTKRYYVPHTLMNKLNRTNLW